MQVVTLTPEGLDAHAEKLACAVEKSSRGQYDAIVGVRRGGSYVCDAFLRHFPKTMYASRYDVTRQRPTTKHKKGALSRILKLLPYPVLDAMRKAEATLLAMRKTSRETLDLNDIEIPDGLAAVLTLNTEPNILVIDDAIDSGDTLFAITETFRKTNPETRIRIAVLTETTDNPRIKATYTIYRNNTLIRFPWSDDYKTPQKRRSEA